MDANETTNRKPSAAAMTSCAGKLAGLPTSEELGAVTHAQGHMQAAIRARGEAGANGVRSATAGDLAIEATERLADRGVEILRYPAALLGDAYRLRSDPGDARQVGGIAESLDALFDDFHGEIVNLMFSSLSTIIFDAKSTRRGQNPGMEKTTEAPEPPDLSTFTGRLEYVRITCRAPSERAFADWIGLASQAVLTNWKARGSFGKGGQKLHRVTGVNTDWLRDGTGTAFLGAPKIYDGPAVVDPDWVESVETAIMGIISVMAAARPDAAEEMAKQWKEDDSIPAKLKEKGLLPLLSGRIQFAVAKARKGSRGKASRV